MCEQLLGIIPNFLNPDDGIRAQAEKALETMKQQNIRQVIQSLIQLYSSDSIDLNIRAQAIICAWRLFPENICDIPYDQPHPFDIYSEELIQSLLTSSFGLLTSSQTNPQIRYFVATLFSRIASIQVHRDLNSNIVGRLSQFLANAQSIEDVRAASIALQKICVEFEPEGEELSSLLTTIFTHLTSPKSIEVGSEVLKILTVVVTSIETIIEDENVVTNIVQTLLNLATIDGMQSAALNVWSEIYKSSSEIFAIVASPLVEISLEILANEAKSVEDLLSASKIVKQIAKLEFKQDMDDFTPVRSHLQPLVISLVRVCCTPDTPDCDDNSEWRPHLAASHALKHVLRLLPDKALPSLFPIINNALSSAQYEERYGALTMLSHAILCAEDPTIGVPFEEHLFKLCQDSAPRVRCESIRCLKNIVMCICDSLSLEENASSVTDTSKLTKIAQQCFGMIQLLDSDSAPIAIQMAKLLGEITRTPNFPHTLVILQNLLQRGTTLHISSYFDIISKIVDCGVDEQTVLGFYPAILETLQIAIGNASSIWALHEIGEIVQAYLIKYGARLTDLAGSTIQALLQGAHAPSIYATDALIPLGMHGQIFPEIFSTFSTATLEVILAALNEQQNPQAIYDASMSLSFIIAGHHITNLSNLIPNFLTLLLQAISNFDLPVDARRSCVQCISDLALYEPSIVNLPMANDIIKYIRTFSVLDALNVGMMTDPKETQLMLHALAQFCNNIMKAVGPQNALAYKDIAHNIIVFVSGIEDIIERLMKSVMELVFLVSNLNKNLMLEMIEDNEEVGNLILTAKATNVPLADEILTTLGYSEE